MKNVTVDFTNEIVHIRAKKYQDSIKMEAVRKEIFEPFFPKKKFMTDYNSYTWDFDSEIFIVNQDKRTYITEDGEMRYMPELIIPMPNLSRKYKEFMNIVMSI
ncbi:hypothetical protein [Butyrivibrio sp. JL13D10]|uniref:hypothetical protein n=1 Tax=Butyrivibrio sp. JL13D10 TaxID=3236815 RepID=UPI0038B6492E